ncbi:N-hydroxyarylamine O-acetyltransferase [Mameliella alba]|uniref:arylamine N-acetyltransferase family protein n=1 Tax=Mameliella alba TaxID=561184 RepID=UPI0013E4F4F2|nr:arylamine N-acetyltransferase [Mameliella alba]BBU58752.1 N-hydroxyarylamine O-acetyltransferase [Mameliella alba]
MSGFDLSLYLDRLRISHVPVTVEGLSRLQSAQIRRIPFEDIDPFLGIAPGVGSAEVADKILHRGRGGYCFEQNRLFQDALQALGFDVTRRLARVRKGARQGGARTHLLLICRIDGIDYLTDAGFGGPTPLEPLLLHENAPQTAPNGSYVLHDDPGTGERVLFLRKPDEEFALYGFDDAHVSDSDIEAGNFLCTHWPQAPFPHHLMVKGYDGDIPLGLLDRQLNEAGEKRLLASAEALHNVLCVRLGLVLPDTTIQALWDRIQVLSAPSP